MFINGIEHESMKNRSSLNWIRWHRYWAGNPVIAALLFFLVIFPLGSVFKLLRIDPLNKTLDQSVNSYWIRRGRTDSKHEDIWRQD